MLVTGPRICHVDTCQRKDCSPANGCQGHAGREWKDHQIAQLVNDLRDVAINYHGSQQLRERIAALIRPVFK